MMRLRVISDMDVGGSGYCDLCGGSFQDATNGRLRCVDGCDWDACAACAADHGVIPAVASSSSLPLYHLARRSSGGGAAAAVRTARATGGAPPRRTARLDPYNVHMWDVEEYEAWREEQPITLHVGMTRAQGAARIADY